MRKSFIIAAASFSAVSVGVIGSVATIYSVDTQSSKVPFLSHHLNLRQLQLQRTFAAAKTSQESGDGNTKLYALDTWRPWNNNWDLRKPRDGESKPKATRHILFIRHGQYFMTENDGGDDEVLTPLGEQQSDLVGKRLVELGHPYTRMLNSGVIRARQTADIIAAKYLADVPRETCVLLNEAMPCEPEPSCSYDFTSEEFIRERDQVDRAFIKHMHRAPVEQKTDSYEVYVIHGNIIRYFVCRLLQLPPEAWLRLSLNNGSITSVSIRPSGRVHINSLGDSGFMPSSMVTVHNVDTRSTTKTDSTSYFTKFKSAIWGA